MQHRGAVRQGVVHEGIAEEERRIRAFIEGAAGFSESAVSMSEKLGVTVETARQVLERYVEMRAVQRQMLEPGMEPVYYRFRAMAS